jgi:hypothetical protein
LVTHDAWIATGLAALAMTLRRLRNPKGRVEIERYARRRMCNQKDPKRKKAPPRETPFSVSALALVSFQL